MLLAAVCGWAGAHWALRGAVEQSERGEEEGEEASVRNSNKSQSWRRGCLVLSCLYQLVSWEIYLILFFLPSQNSYIPSYHDLQPDILSHLDPRALVSDFLSDHHLHSLFPRSFAPISPAPPALPSWVTSGFPERSSSSSSST